LDIFWLGHSCFRIKGKEATIVTDPYDPSIGYTSGKQTADIITISHGHPGHSYLGNCEDGYRVINGPGEYELKGVFITGIQTYHDQAEGQERGKNTIYIFEIDGITLCHLGDLGHSLSASVIESIGNVTILFLPVGDVSTIDSIVAAELVRAISPKIVIPMHYKTDAVTKQLDSVELFLKKMGIKDVEPQPKLSLTRSVVSDNLQVVLLNYPGQVN
jgi:L-ascorbate metabolism protein UlaG (beta-lactamase superfamily)